MLLIALDTCDSNGSVAVLRDAETLHTVVHDSSDDYSSWLLPAVQTALQTAGTTLADVDAYAVAAGPGSFTGVRVGLATVKAWAEVYGRPIAAVSRLEALATLASEAAPYVAAFADGRRGQLFAALYRRHGGALERLEEEMVIAPERFVAWAAGIAGGNRIVRRIVMLYQSGSDFREAEVCIHGQFDRSRADAPTGNFWRRQP